MIRVLLAENMAMLLGALAALLSYEKDIEVVAELDQGELIVPTAQDTNPDVAVIDVELAGMADLAVARELQLRVPNCSTVLLANKGNPRMLRQALDVGAKGIVVKHAPPQRLAETIRRVANGERVVDAKLAMTALATTPNNPLTPREVEVLRFAAEGASVPEIAGELYLAAGTVRNYLSIAIGKLQARNRVDAIRIAREAGWL